MGLPGKVAFSFLRGEKVENTVQHAMRMGIEVKSAKKSVVRRPPPNLRAIHQGTMKSSEKRRALEKESLLGPSAGSGPFLMEGYCENC